MRHLTRLTRNRVGSSADASFLDPSLVESRAARKKRVPSLRKRFRIFKEEILLS